MKTYIYKSFFWLVLLVLAGCQEKEEFGKASDGNISLKASIEKTESRTSVDEEGCVLWVNTDAIGVFGNETKNAKFQSISSGTDVLFVGKMASSQDVPILAYYPYNEYAVLDGNTLSFDLPSEYAYTGESNAPMLGIRQPDGSFVFKHLCGLLQVTVENVPEDAKSLNIVSEGTEGQEAPYIAGSVTINDVTAENATISIAKDGSRELSIGLENTSSQETCTFNIPVPLGDYPKLSVKLMMDDGTVSMDKTISDVSMTRAKMLDMPAVDVEKESGVVTITEAGTLKQLLGEDFLNITKLKIVGPINGDDVRCLRQMLGGNEYAEKGMLTSLDLSKASIVKGGSWYAKLNEDMLEYTYCYTSNDEIGIYMFTTCVNLQNLVLPDNVVSIGRGAFKGATSLSSVHISDLSVWCNITFKNGYSNPLHNGAKLYVNNKELTELVVPEGITEIKDYAFYKYLNLFSVTFNKGIVSIGKGAFCGCFVLNSVVIPDGVTSIGESAFFDCSSLSSVTLGKGLTSIGDGAFNSCESLVSIDIPSSVTSIGKSAFRYCSSLRSVNLGNGLTSMGQYVFSNCNALTSIAIPDGVSMVSFSALSYCPALTSVTLGKNVTSIEGYAFYGCSSLVSINIPHGVTSIKGYAFNSCKSLASIELPDALTALGTYVFEDCKALASIKIPDGVTKIEQGAFDGCKSLADITIGKGVTSIGLNAFLGCSSLLSINIPDAVTSINRNAFAGCSSMSRVILGKGVDTIGEDAFGGCNALANFYCYGTTPPKIDTYSFRHDKEKVTLHVPAGCSTKYRATIWKNYFTNILEIN